ncbi:MAG: NUDIX domain-containing protein [Nanoarchaeota archaeon]|nr:NUDIX domain-containing protein [Nanoarchaeota archaeon]
MSNENIIIVDDNDNIIGSKPRDIVDKEKLRYRVSCLWIKNSNDEILFARRAYIKTHFPGKWGPAVSGTVEENETYEENIIKESEEELGLRNINIKKTSKTKSTGEHNHFTQWFISIINKSVEDFEIQKDEVAEVKWFSRKEFLDCLEKNPNDFIPRMKEYFEIFENNSVAIYTTSV